MAREWHWVSRARAGTTMAAVIWERGHVVSGKTALGEPFVGEVYCFDAATSLAVLRQESETSNNHDVRVLHVVGATELKSAPPSLPPISNEPLPVVDQARCKRREDANLKAAMLSAGASFVNHNNPTQ